MLGLIREFMSMFGHQKRTRERLDRLMDELAGKPFRGVRPLAEHDDLALQWNAGLYAGDGLRWESDAEYRERIKANQKTTATVQEAAQRGAIQRIIWPRQPW